MGGRSGGSRDAIMRNLLAENMDKASTRRTVAAITERNPADANADVAEDEARSRPTQAIQVEGAVQVASGRRSPADHISASPARSLIAAATAARAAATGQARARALSSGVIQTQPIAAVPGSTEPMKPVRVKTVQIKAGQVKVASAAASQPVAPITSSIPRHLAPDIPETSGAVVAKAEANRPAAEMPPQPANFGTGNGVLGVLPASSVTPPRASQAMAYARSQPAAAGHSAERRHQAYSQPIPGGSFRSARWKARARRRNASRRREVRPMACSARPIPLPKRCVAKGDKKLYRARFAGLDRDQAEAVCRTLKRSEISCITVKN